MNIWTKIWNNESKLTFSLISINRNFMKTKSIKGYKIIKQENRNRLKRCYIEPDYYGIILRANPSQYTSTAKHFPRNMLQRLTENQLSG